MNVDTKIASKALALRMKKVIPNTINCDQTAYVKSRFIGESIRLIDDLLYHTEQENLDGILFAADMEKAFDSLEHNFIYADLEKIGFGEDFIQWILTTPGWIGLKFDIFELMFNEILVMPMHNSQLVYNFYEEAIKLFL